ncbi:MAG: nickel pincer cofactor biosynthesis protein LarB [Candidatus Thorarchaeota archaeon]|jgi:NCAIR mutase (PurE)-related protein
MTTTREILKALASGEMSVEEAEKALRLNALSEVGNIGMLDVNRGERSGVPEVVFAETKSISNLTNIVEVMVEKNKVIMLTRLTKEKLDGIKSAHPNLVYDVSGTDDHLTVIAHTKEWTDPPCEGKIAIMTAGTSDITFAHEAEYIARLMGVESLTFFDVGVAGIHRLIEPIKKLIDEEVDAVVVFAGMEGALPTVVASLIDVPVIGVPVPTGYGFGGKGETALASMLQSCSPGLAVVNIGNGLGGGSVASLIAKRSARMREQN